MGHKCHYSKEKSLASHCSVIKQAKRHDKTVKEVWAETGVAGKGFSLLREFSRCVVLRGQRQS